ncbi:unnamed protein product, partial [Brassica oleracea var. botrytis]
MSFLVGKMFQTIFRTPNPYMIIQLFQKRKPSDLGYTVLVKPKESFEKLETIIRDL